MLRIDSGSKIPIYRQIYEQIKGEILSGALVAGQKLPSTRFLSKDLKVGRNTVENAYAQLVSEGYVASRTGSGYVVLNVYIQKKDVKTSQKEIEKSHDANEAVYHYNFLYGSITEAPFPKTSWRRALNMADAKLSHKLYTSYGHQQGEPRFRKALSHYVYHHRGIAIDSEQILICAGIEYGLTLLCQMFRLMGIDTVAMEEPGYKGARDFFKHHGMTVIPIAVLDDGIDVEALNATPAKVVYVTPSHQFPTGAVMPIHKRQALLKWAQTNNAYIIEDDYDSELRYNSRPIPSIGSIEGGSRVIYMATFSKALSPSLRVSYMSLPMDFMSCYKNNFGMYQCSVSMLIQEALTELLENGQYETHLRKLSVINKRKHNKLIQAIKQYLGGQVTIHGGQAGNHILLEVKCDYSETELIEMAKKSGIILMPASPFWSNRSPCGKPMFILAFGNIKEDEIDLGVLALSNAWNIQ